MWEQVAFALPDAPAAIHGERCISWAEFDRRAGALAAELLEQGLEVGAKVAQYLPNRPEYLESFYAATKVSMVPVNTNYRYLDGELAYLWDNADVEAVVFDGQYTEVVERVRVGLRDPVKTAEVFREVGGRRWSKARLPPPP